MVTIRKGTQHELSQVYTLVKALAIYERAEDEVITSVADYERDYAAGWFDFIVAASDDGAVKGMMLYYNSYSTWKGPMLYLEDFVVEEASRQQGIGLLLWEGLVQEARKKGCTSIKWQVLDWNEPAKAFYRKIGAELDPEWENGRLWL